MAIKMVLASKNVHKAKEVQAIMGDEYEIITQDKTTAADIDVIEDGTTFEENAIKKAVSIMEATGMLTVADDSGLCVDALDGKPGVYTARYAGENATDDENITKLLGALEGVAEEGRGAAFVSVIALASPTEGVKTFRGECRGRILTEKHGENGFGYDPIFYYPPLGKTTAELDPEEKNQVSHRANALKLFYEKMKEAGYADK